MISKLLPEWLKTRLLRLYSAGKYRVTIGHGTRASFSTVIEPNVKIGKDCDICGSKIGQGTYLADNARVSLTEIGRFCSIGQNVQTCLGRHPTSGFVSTHPAFFSTQQQAGFTFVDQDLFAEHLFADPGKKYVAAIGNDVWIGNNVMIMDGIKIGDGAIIAAGAVVTKDVEPYAIVGGVPAKVIRYRFERQEIEFLLRFRWWDRSIEWLIENADIFKDIKSFIIRFKEHEK